MPYNSWKSHAWRLLLALTVIMSAGIASGQWLLVLLLSVSAYLAWQIYNLWKLHRWLNQNEKGQLKSIGIWARQFDEITHLQDLNLARLKEQKSRVEAVQSINNAYPDAGIVLNDEAGLSWFNDAAETLLGLQRPADLGQLVTNLIRDPDFSNWLSVQDQVNSQVELPGPTDPSRILSASAIPIGEGERLIIFRDITDIHNLERIRRDFVANVSHELRTPLTVLHGYLEGFEDVLVDQPDAEELVSAVKRMRKQAKKMAILLNDLLELSRVESDKHESEGDSIDVAAMFAQLKEQAEEVSQGNHNFIFDAQTDLCLRGISADIESAFRNLIQNAIHYTPAGGEIEVLWKEDESAAVFSVRDTGTGIPKRDIPRLTERFYRVGSDRSRHSGGTGLGLAIVKHVMNAHQGRLQIESALGEGSTFICRFGKDRMVKRERSALS